MQCFIEIRYPYHPIFDQEVCAVKICKKYTERYTLLIKIAISGLAKFFSDL